LVGVLTKVITKANPDFDDKIDEVMYWLVECDTETGVNSGHVDPPFRDVDPPAKQAIKVRA
jgi:hypothetical protein